jgi:GPH family glycoside/pentoside/hexuronide:cation symporter
VFIYTLIITYFNYDPTVSTQESIWGIRLGVGLLPAVFLVIALIPLLMYPINRKRELEIKQQIEALHS